MSRLMIPVLSRFLWTTGDLLLRAELTLNIRTKQRTWEPVVFRADSGTEMTTMSAADAQALDVAFPPAPVTGLVHAQTGQVIYSGVLRVRVEGMDATEYVFPCYFVGDPNIPTASIPSLGQRPRNLLGLTGVINQLRLAFDGIGVPGALHGHLIVEKV